MSGYPLFLKLKGQRCLVFGGGEVALRKIQALLKRGALVTCMSKDFCESLMKLAKKNKQSLRLLRPPQYFGGLAMTGKGSQRPLVRQAHHPEPCRGARNDELNGTRLVIAATSDRSFNSRLARACQKKRILINVVDDPELCDFYVPAVVEKGPLQIAISTDGASPLFAKRLREELEKAIPNSTGEVLTRLGKIRDKVRRGKN